MVLYFLRLGTLGFGGPIALVGYMQTDLVEDRKWVSSEEYFEGLAFSQLCPGPLAAQLAKYLGWMHSGTLGATLTGAAFVLPSFLMVLGLFTGLLGPASAGTMATLFLFFLKAGAFVFGSGLAIVPFLYGGVVGKFHWLTERQFLDAVAVAMITPGPVVITSGFIGYLVAGFAGACVAALGTFLPCYAFVVIAAPAFRKYGKRPAIAAFVKGVTAAAIGAITGAVIILGRRTIIDIPTVLLALVTLALLWRWKKIPEPFIVLGAAVIGLVVYSALHH